MLYQWWTTFLVSGPVIISNITSGCGNFRKSSFEAQVTLPESEIARMTAGHECNFRFRQCNECLK